MPSTPVQPFSNLQPSLGIIEVTPQIGVFPQDGSGGASGDMLGFIYDFAGSFSPGDSFALQGQTLQISSHQALFALFGTTYGGNGSTTFVLPDLRGRAVIGTGTGPGLPTATEGVAVGSATATLTLNQIPPDTTPSGGGGLPFDNTQPSLPLAPLICVNGIVPTQGGSSGSATFIGQIAYFSGTITPGSWLPADGRLMPIASNQALFAILGTTYGGNGVTTFALPDLRGRIAVGASTANPVGTVFGQSTTTLTTADLPAPTGTDQPVNNDQPSLAVNYLIATSGIFPQQSNGSGFDTDFPIVGQIVAFAGSFVPSGWALANGALLSIASNSALFALLGTQYGGDGVSTFALPDLRGRTVLGTGTSGGTTYNPGTTVGSDTITLSAANIPTASCFTTGTRIALSRGAIAVEDLRVGDLARAASGGLRPIVWIGHRHIDLARLEAPHDVHPIRVQAHAFGPGLPCRDLYLSPEHAVFAAGVLIPVGTLENGATIRTAPRPAVTYWHVELDAHDVILAEALPVESYLDCGNREDFDNVAEPTGFPDLAGETPPASPCAPILRQGPIVERVRRSLARQAATAPALSAAG